MKIAATILALIAVPAHAVDWKESPYDKAAHIAIGGAVSCAVSRVTGNKFYGLLTALAIGTAKELSDDNFDGGDFASWGVGGAAGMLCWDWK